MAKTTSDLILGMIWRKS